MPRKYDNQPIRISSQSRIRAEDALSKIRLSPGMTANDVVETVAEVIGKPIVLESTVDERFKTTTGSFAITLEFVFIVFRGIDPHSYQMHSLFHELGHLLCGHTNCERPATAPDSDPTQQLLWNEAEREAEFLAYKIAALISRKPRSSQAFG